jgi:hypothetical protein
MIQYGNKPARINQVMNPKLHSSAKFSEKSPIRDEFGRTLKLQLYNVVEAGGDGSASERPAPDPLLTYGGYA